MGPQGIHVMCLNGLLIFFVCVFTGADVNHQDCRGNSPLHLAVSYWSKAEVDLQVIIFRALQGQFIHLHHYTTLLCLCFLRFVLSLLLKLNMG